MIYKTLVAIQKIPSKKRLISGKLSAFFFFYEELLLKGKKAIKIDSHSVI